MAGRDEARLWPLPAGLRGEGSVRLLSSVLRNGRSRARGRFGREVVGGETRSLRAAGDAGQGGRVPSYLKGWEKGIVNVFYGRVGGEFLPKKTPVPTGAQWSEVRVVKEFPRFR